MFQKCLIAETRSKLGLQVQFLCSGSMPMFYVLEKNAQAKYIGSILRLNTQVQYLSLFVLKKLLKLNVQDQCLGLM